MNAPTREKLPPLPAQPEGVAWPTREWPEGDLPHGTDVKRLKMLMDHAFAEKARGHRASAADGATPEHVPFSRMLSTKLMPPPP